LYNTVVFITEKYPPDFPVIEVLLLVTPDPGLIFLFPFFYFYQDNSGYTTWHGTLAGPLSLNAA